MLNFTKKLVLLGLVITIAGCSSWAALFRSEKPVNATKTADPAFASSKPATSTSCGKNSRSRLMSWLATLMITI